MMGFTQLLQREEMLTDALRERYLRAVLEHGGRMDRIIQQVLDLSERVPWDVREVDPAALLRETLEGLEPLALARQLKLARELPEELPRVEGDRDRLVQLVSNLVANAIQYSDPGGTVTVSAGPARLPGERLAVEVRIKDEGPGIPSNEIASVFDPFARGAGARPGGAGLGLHVCQLVVRRHGGRIWVESKRGAGSTFVFQIPAVAPDEAPPRVAVG
jgi:signal transduction histidine kinase